MGLRGDFLSKQDRQAVRTAPELERKYNFSKMKNSQSSAQLEQKVNELNRTFNQYMVETKASIEKLTDKYDSSVTDEELQEELKKKADLVDGKVPSTQLPEIPSGGDGELPDNVLTQDDLAGAINAALEQAKESGEFDGEKGDDAEVTSDNIISALGYTPANASLCVEDTTHPGCYYRMVGEAKEWINPPMKLGVPYRTTKRYDGKAVYTILQDLGNLPASGTSSVTLKTGTNVLPDKYLFFQTIIKGSSSKRTYLGGTVVDNSGNPICRIGIEGTKTIETRVYANMSKYSGQIYAEYTIQE